MGLGTNFHEDQNTGIDQPAALSSDAVAVEETDLFGRSDGAQDLDYEHWLDCRLPSPSECYSPSGSGHLEHVKDACQGEYSKDQSLDRSWMQLEQKPVEFFWEHGFWADIFGDNDSDSAASTVVRQFSLHRPAVVSEPVFEVVESETVGTSDVPQKRFRAASYMDVVSKSSVQSWKEHRDSMWEVAIRRWHSSAMTWKGDDNFVKMLQAKTDFRGQCQILVDVLHHKSPATLLKRCNNLSRLVNDLHAHNLEFPCSESELYDHLCRQRSEGAPASRLKALLEAVTFVRHVFGCESLDFAVKSRRFMGAASSKTVETVKQAPPLKVEHLRCILMTLEQDPDPWNVAFCGMVLFCVYGRARWSDAQHSQFVEWDQDSGGNYCYVECSTAVHKTCRALNMRHSFLPLTAPGLGINDNGWALHWHRARLDLDIEDLNIFPLMPAPDEEGIPSVRPLSTAEAGKWLQLILMQQSTKMSVQPPLKYTTHSFKAICLSFLAKYGAAFEDRLALGYHTDQVRMALRYSRDGASRPLRVLEDCLQAIRVGRFLPDETRSGRFVANLVDLNTDGNVVIENAAEGVKHETSEHVDASEIHGECIDLLSDYATTCSSSSDDDEAVVLPKMPNRLLIIPDDVDVWQHIKLRTVHLAPKGNIRVLSCGRKITDRFVKEEVDHRFDVIKCKPCFKTIAPESR